MQHTLSPSPVVLLFASSSTCSEDMQGLDSIGVGYREISPLSQRTSGSVVCRHIATTHKQQEDEYILSCPQVCPSKVYGVVIVVVIAIVSDST